jgi:hypothetical protein
MNDPDFQDGSFPGTAAWIFVRGRAFGPMNAHGKDKTFSTFQAPEQGF